MRDGEGKLVFTFELNVLFLFQAIKE